jgi:hypothetical protein
LIFRHSFHGQGFAGKRVGQQPLQGFHLAPAASLCCLDDACLQPSDVAFTLRPVKLFPGWRVAGGGTHGRIHVHLRFPPAKVLRVVSSRMTRWKSARLCGGIILQPLSARLPDGIGFFQHPLPANSSAHLAATPTPCLRTRTGRVVGFTVFRSSNMKELVPVFSPAVLNVRVPQARSGATDCFAFWRKPVSVFGLMRFTVFTTVHLCWTYPPA